MNDQVEKTLDKLFQIRIDKLETIDVHDYKTYWKLVEDKWYRFDNTLTNTYGSLDYTKDLTNLQFYLYNSIFFTADKSSSDKILDKIKEVKCEKDYLNSRCYPGGIFFPGNIMVVGENPGFKKGCRGLEETWLKPSFVFTKTSYILRKTLYLTFRELNRPAPYITNLLKYARPGNKIQPDEYFLTLDILNYEMETVKPKIVIFLGNNTYNFCRENVNLDGIISYKVPHPASILYGNMNEEEYLEIWKKLKF